jgi:hypothetical protein
MSLQIPIFKCQWVKHLQGVQIDDYGFTIIDKCFTFLIPNEKKQRVVGVDNVEDEEEHNQCGEVPLFVDAKRINIFETKISYSNVIPYSH